MRLGFATVFVASSLMVLPDRSDAQVSLGGFGALPVNQLSSLGDSGFPVDFGGRVAVDLAPGVQALGEFGRIGSVLPSIIGLPISFARLNLTVSAFYGEGGMRLLAAPRSAVSPYVEGTAGVAHLRFGATGLGSTADTIARAALNLVDTRDPMVGVGGGVLLHGGPVQVDVGYRYKRILANSVLSSVLGVGQGLQTHQVRFGVGVRF